MLQLKALAALFQTKIFFWLMPVFSARNLALALSRSCEVLTPAEASFSSVFGPIPGTSTKPSPFVLASVFFSQI